MPFEIRTMPQNQLTAECWDVQFGGLEACEKCEFRDTEECGGQAIRKTGLNEKGIPVLLGVRHDID